MKNNNYSVKNLQVITTQVTLKEDLTKKCAKSRQNKLFSLFLPIIKAAGQKVNKMQTV